MTSERLSHEQEVGQTFAVCTREAWGPRAVRESDPVGTAHWWCPFLTCSGACSIGQTMGYPGKPTRHGGDFHKGLDPSKGQAVSSTPSVCQAQSPWRLSQWDGRCSHLKGSHHGCCNLLHSHCTPAKGPDLTSASLLSTPC